MKKNFKRKDYNQDVVFTSFLIMVYKKSTFLLPIKS